MLSIPTITVTVITNTGLSTGAMKSQPVHNYFFRDHENCKMTSEVMQPNRLLHFSLWKTEAMTCLKAPSEFCAVVGKRVSSAALCQALCWELEREGIQHCLFLRSSQADKGDETPRWVQERDRCLNGDKAGGIWPLLHCLTLRTQQVWKWKSQCLHTAVSCDQCWAYQRLNVAQAWFPGRAQNGGASISEVGLTFYLLKKKLLRLTL